MPSTSTWPNCSRTLGRTITSAADRNSLSRGGSCQPARNTSSAPMRAIVSSGCSPSHSPGKPPRMTSGARRAKRGRGRGVGLDQQRQALDRGEAADVEEDRAVAGEAAQIAPPHSGPSRAPHRAPSRAARGRGAGARIQPVDVARAEDRPGRSRWGRRRSGRGRCRALSGAGRRACARATISRSQRCAQCRIRSRQASRCGQRPGWLLEHQQLRAVQVADHRDIRRDALGGGVERRQVVEVQDVVPAAPASGAPAPRRRPGARRRRRRARRRRGRARPGGPRRRGAWAARRPSGPGLEPPRSCRRARRRSPRRSRGRRRAAGAEPATSRTAQPERAAPGRGCSSRGRSRPGGRTGRP